MNSYFQGGMRKTLFVKNKYGNILMVRRYVCDIVFGGMSSTIVNHFVQKMQVEFDMSHLFTWL